MSALPGQAVREVSESWQTFFGSSPKAFIGGLVWEGEEMSVHKADWREGYLCLDTLWRSLEKEWDDGHKPNVLVVAAADLLGAKMLTESRMLDGKSNPLAGCGLSVVADLSLSPGTWVLGHVKEVKKYGVWKCAYCGGVLKEDVWTCPNCLAVRQEVLESLDVRY